MSRDVRKPFRPPHQADDPVVKLRRTAGRAPIPTKAATGAGRGHCEARQRDRTVYLASLRRLLAICSCCRCATADLSSRTGRARIRMASPRSAARSFDNSRWSEPAARGGANRVRVHG